MSSTVVFNVSATTFVNQPVTVSLSGLIKPDATVTVVAGDNQATAFKQNVTFMPPLDFVGTSIINCDASDGNKIVISVLVIPKPSGAEPAEAKVRTQIRTTTMAGDPVEDRFWTITEDTGKIEGPMASYVPLKISKVKALGYEEEHPPEEVLVDSNSFFVCNGIGSWIELDLGQLYNISEINIRWRSSSSFSLAISKDKKTFSNIYQGRGIGISSIKMPGSDSIILFKITSMDNNMEIFYISVKGSPITPKPTATGAQAVLIHNSQIVSPGQLVTMDGSLSRGDITRYVWDHSSDPVVTLFNEKTPIASFIAPEVEEATTLQFTLTVVDRNGQYSKAESLIHIEATKKEKEKEKEKPPLQKLDDVKENPCCRSETDPDPILITDENSPFIDFCGDCGGSFQTQQDFDEHIPSCSGKGKKEDKDKDKETKKKGKKSSS